MMSLELGVSGVVLLPGLFLSIFQVCPKEDEMYEMPSAY